MTTSLYLDPNIWDLTVDVNGDIALCSQPYAAAQDAGCQIKLWNGELWYDTKQGVTWFNVYGKLPPLTYLRAQLIAAALLVPNVIRAKVFFKSFNNRVVSGQVQVITPDTPTAVAVNF